MCWPLHFWLQRSGTLAAGAAATAAAFLAASIAASGSEVWRPHATTACASGERDSRHGERGERKKS